MTPEERLASKMFTNAYKWWEWGLGARVWYNEIYSGSFLWSYECGLRGQVHFIGNDGVSPSIEVIDAKDCFLLLDHPATKGVLLDRVRTLAGHNCHVQYLNGSWKVYYPSADPFLLPWENSEALALLAAIHKLDPFTGDLALNTVKYFNHVDK